LSRIISTLTGCIAKNILSYLILGAMSIDYWWCPNGSFQHWASS